MELRDGQTFAIAGLMNNTLTNSMSKIPGIGDIPILGLLFRSKAHQKNQTELVVMITPTIVRRGQTGVSEGLPSLVEPVHGRAVEDAPESRPLRRIAALSDQSAAAEQLEQQAGAAGAGCTGGQAAVASRGRDRRLPLARSRRRVPHGPDRRQLRPRS